MELVSRDVVTDSDVIIKEQKLLLSINSNQRNVFSSEKLDQSPDAYKPFLTEEMYEAFKTLYLMANNHNSEEEIGTFQEYAAQNNVTIEQITEQQAHCRDIVRAAIAQVPENTPEVADLNSTLIDLLVSVTATASGRADFESIASQLNNYLVSAPFFNPTSFHRPFYFDGKIIKQLVYKEQTPDRYRVTLPNTIHHVKSLYLMNVEIPNTINNITNRNNIITIQLRYKAVEGINNGLPRPVELDTDYAAFNFIFVALDVGIYTIDSILSHMEQAINQEVYRSTTKRFANAFDVSWNRSTGKVAIACNRAELEFHLKFYSEMSDIDSNQETTEGVHGIVNNYSHDLWHILGFQWPYEISSDGTDNYVDIRTNVVKQGIHPVLESLHPNNDIFQRDTVTNLQERLESFSPAIVERVHRYPGFTNRYIYLRINNIQNIIHINNHNNVTSFDSRNRNIVAKVQISGTPGETIYRQSSKANTVIFPFAVKNLDTLDIQWVDERGMAVDFNNADHSFGLEIIYFTSLLAESHEDSSLGFRDNISVPKLLGKG